MSATHVDSLPDAFRDQALLVTADEVARMISASSRTVRRLDSAGRLPQGFRIGGLKRWRRAEVIAWIAAGCPTRRDWTWDGTKGER